MSSEPDHAPPSFRHRKWPPSIAKRKRSPFAFGIPPASMSNASDGVESDAYAVPLAPGVNTQAGNGPSTLPVTDHVCSLSSSRPPARYRSAAAMTGRTISSPTWYVAGHDASPIASVIVSPSFKFATHDGSTLTCSANSWDEKYLPSSLARREE